MLTADTRQLEASIKIIVSGKINVCFIFVPEKKEKSNITNYVILPKM